MALQLVRQGRIWWCACGRPSLWDGALWSAHTSQHLFDHYSLTHVLHGILFCGLFWWLFPRLRYGWRLWGALCLEALWELLENTPWIIRRYRAVTIDKGYEGDSIANSIGDVGCCALGFVLASRLGWKGSAALFLAVELGLLIAVRDNLTLNVLMLLCPIEAVRQWQMGG